MFGLGSVPCLRAILVFSCIGGTECTGSIKRSIPSKCGTISWHEIGVTRSFLVQTVTMVSWSATHIPLFPRPLRKVKMKPTLYPSRDGHAGRHREVCGVLTDHRLPIRLIGVQRFGLSWWWWLQWCFQVCGCSPVSIYYAFRLLLQTDG